MHFSPTTVLLSSFALVALTACGGGGDGRTDITQDPLFFGAVDDTASGNGLPFSAEGEPESTMVTGVTVPVVTVDIAATRVPGNVRVAQSTVSAGTSFTLGGEADFDIEIDGETVTLVDGIGVLSDGRTIEAVRLVPTLPGNLTAFAISGPSAYESISAFGFRNETPPSIIDGRAGTANFDGPLELLTAAYLDGTLVDIGTQLEGVMTINVDFSTRTLSGNISDMELGADEATLSGTLNESTFVGNGAIGDITWTCGNGATCNDTSDFGLVFARAGRLAMVGLTSIDADITLADDREVSLVGAGGFTVLED